MTQGLIEIGFSKEEAERISPLMDKYINEIILFNSAYNLTNTSDKNELIIRHIYDSLAPYKTFCKIFESSKTNPNFSVGDIGSGGGLPGIPLAAAFPNINFYLIERMSKRCAFLENVAAILGLKNVVIINSEAEKLSKELFDVITFRAFRPLDEKMTGTLLGITKPSGILAAYKAKKENIITEMEGIKKLVPQYDIIPLSVPELDDSERNLVLINKQG
ncbi:MAG: 16S rRNA (guanine(527)-N(7))-methyltransferase RsmG [Treponema sp.]|nr:16S rRNA (guanine(527)-N(7))-methyltransferase RsmG [Treponema sp.]